MNHSTWLGAAVELTHELWKRSNRNAKACRWAGDELFGDHADNMRVVHTDLGPGLYAGSAGIGAFVATVGDCIGDKRFVRAGVSAVLGAVQECQRDLSQLSLYSGATGVALKAVELAQHLHHDALLDAGLQLAAASALRLSAEPPEETDLLGGLAGAVIALCAIHRMQPMPELLHAVRSATQLICARRREGLVGCFWPSANDATPHGLCGLGHGASGVAWALFEAASWLEDVELAELATEALRYERSWFEPAHCNWADLRGAAAHSSMIAWCHGAIGIGALRFQHYERSADPSALAEASASILAARTAAGAARRALEEGQAPDVTLCHGLGGVIELLLLAYEVTQQPEHMRAARRVGELGLEIFERNHRNWPVGLTGAKNVPGLMTGLAGIGTWLLRLHDPALIGSPLLVGRSALQGFSGPVVTNASASA